MINSDDEKFMRLALNQAQLGVEQGQTPFGACIVKEGQVIAAAYNHVWADTDITAHAEIMAIRDACQKQHQVFLEGTTLYSTLEPCPMCFSAAHWARIGRIVYGLSIADAQKFGFNELAITNKTLTEISFTNLEIVPNVLRAENLMLWQEWASRPDKKVY